MAGDDQKTEKSDETLKTEKSDETKKTEKGKPSTDEDSLKKEKQLSFDAGEAKGAKKGASDERERIFKELDFEDLDSVKAALKKGKDAFEKVESTKSKGEKAIDELRAEYEAREEKLRKKWEPIFEKALEREKDEEEKELFEKLSVIDPETTRAFMKLYEPNEDESKEDHVKRILEMKPKLKGDKKKTVTAETEVKDRDTSPETRQKELAKRVRGYYGSKRLDQLAQKAEKEE